MNYFYVTIYVLTCGVALSACRDNKDTESGAVTSGAPTTPATLTATGTTIRARIHPGLPEFSFTVVGKKSEESSETLNVEAIEIRRGEETNPIQVLDALDTDTPMKAETPGLSVLDMNFDGYGDLRLIEFQPAGPNVPYLNWLFDPTLGRFIENEALNEITSPQFDPVSREIRSDWRDSATSYGTNIYVFRADEPVLVRKETKEYKSPGVYALQVSRLVDGTWKVVEQREVREP